MTRELNSAALHHSTMYTGLETHVEFSEGLALVL